MQMKSKSKVIRYSCLVVSIVLIGIGVVLGQHEIVHMKAIRICLECIGIG